MLRLKAAVLMPPLAVPTRDVTSERSANGVLLSAAPTLSARSSCVDVVAQSLQLRRHRQQAGHAGSVARLLRPIDRRRFDDGLRLDDGLGLGVSFDDAFLDDGLRLGRGLLADDGRRRWRRDLALEHETHETLRHFFGRGRIDLRLRQHPKKQPEHERRDERAARELLELRIVLEPRGPRQLVDSIQCDRAVRHVARP